jgi:hypothetical protein
MEVQCGPRFVWFENFEKKEGQWASERDIKVIWPLRNLKPLFDEEGGVWSDYWTEFRWPLAHANVKLWECICHLICIWFVFCLYCILVFCHKTFQCGRFIMVPLRYWAKICVTTNKGTKIISLYKGNFIILTLGELVVSKYVIFIS